MDHHFKDPPYYYEELPREAAEMMLWERGCLDGMYLIRKSMTRDADWVLSICHNKRVLHYRIKKLPDNLIGVHGIPSQQFESLSHLIQEVSGLICKPQIPCNKPLNKIIPNHDYGLNDNEVLQAVRKKLEEWGIQDEGVNCADRHGEIYNLVLKSIHESQSWFHGKISRAEAEKRLFDSGLADGKYLVRERDDCSYVLCVVHSGLPKHYKIDVWSTGELGIQDGPRFDNLIALICHYTVLNDGLWCCLKEPCHRPREGNVHETQPSEPQSPLSPGPFENLVAPDFGNNCNSGDPLPHFNQIIHENSATVEPKVSNFPLPKSTITPHLMVVNAPSIADHLVNNNVTQECLKPHPPSTSISSTDVTTTSMQPSINQTVPSLVLPSLERDNVPSVVTEPPYESIDSDDDGSGSGKVRMESETKNGLLTENVQSATWDEPKERTTKILRKPTWTKEESEHHFKTVRKYRKNPRSIQGNSIELQQKLGTGNFGDVFKAVYKTNNIEVTFAVKVLKRAVVSVKDDIMREAEMMTDLDHPNIVRLMGVCERTDIMLVMELAPLGPLNTYLQHHRETPVSDILLLMQQVAQGMRYLESKQFVHRDLAARNVLLVNENFAKISDFGMSRALGLHQDYYKVEPSGKLPLKWYAPECIYYFRFSTKSDVWSYGVCMWEAMSYGERPYQGLTGQEILRMFAENKRLPCPLNCSQDVYNIMLDCWIFSAEERPTFGQVCDKLQLVVIE